MGLEIALMHYTGMAAMQLKAIAQYNLKLVVLSSRDLYIPYRHLVCVPAYTDYAT